MNNKCPVCGAIEYIDIIYGYPSKRLLELAEEAQVKLGGCCIEPGAKSKCCKNCDTYYDYDMPPMRELQSLKISISSFFGGSSYFYMDEKNLFFVKSEIVEIDEFDPCSNNETLGKKVIIKPSLTQEEKGRLIYNIEKHLDSIHIDSWKKKYDNSDVCDCDCWELEIKYSGADDILISGLHHRPIYWYELISFIKEQTDIEIEECNNILSNKY